MAAVLTPKSLSFPHNILQDNFDHSVFPKMHRESPPRPSLPSISDLIADLDKTAENASATSPSLDPQRRISAGSNGTQPSTPDRMAFVTSPTSGLPPTPPLPGTSSFDFAPRPGSLIIGSPITHSGPQNGHFPRSPSTTTSADAYLHQRSSYPPVPDTAAWNNSKSPVASRRASDESRVEQHGTKPESSYPNLPETNSAYSGLSQQRPLPANFPPSVPVPGQQHSPSDARMGGTQYEHHHHYPVSGTSPYPQATDRYQCPTCQKAFSRPSSLKIHTYSHTGEKPFKCKYEGCGKYFSVRSNMKRHEKGCHGAESSSNGGNSPKGS